MANLHVHFCNKLFRSMTSCNGSFYFKQTIFFIMNGQFTCLLYCVINDQVHDDAIGTIILGTPTPRENWILGQRVLQNVFWICGSTFLNWINMIYVSLCLRMA